MNLIIYRNRRFLKKLYSFKINVTSFLHCAKLSVACNFHRRPSILKKKGSDWDFSCVLLVTLPWRTWILNNNFVEKTINTLSRIPVFCPKIIRTFLSLNMQIKVGTSIRQIYNFTMSVTIVEIVSWFPRISQDLHNMITKLFLSWFHISVEQFYDRNKQEQGKNQKWTRMPCQMMVQVSK